jgi:hypothetical protein
MNIEYVKRKQLNVSITLALTGFIIRFPILLNKVLKSKQKKPLTSDTSKGLTKGEKKLPP